MFVGKGRELAAQGVKLGLVVGAFQGCGLFVPQKYENWLEYQPKILLLRYGFRRKVRHQEQFVGAEAG